MRATVRGSPRKRAGRVSPAPENAPSRMISTAVKATETATIRQ